MRHGLTAFLLIIALIGLDGCADNPGLRPGELPETGLSQVPLHLPFYGDPANGKFLAGYGYGGSFGGSDGNDDGD